MDPGYTGSAGAEVGVGIGFGKLLLFGEHAAVYGKPAVGISLPYFTEAKLSHSRDKEERLNFFGVPREYHNIVLDLVTHINSELSMSLDGFDLHLRSTLPTGIGLGSSAALCVAVASTLKSLNQKKSVTTNPNHKIWEIANRGERLFHGTPSGIDTGLSLFGGLQAFYPSPPALPRQRSLKGRNFFLLIGSIPRLGNTRSLVNMIREGMKNQDPVTMEGVTTLGELAEKAIDILGAEQTAGYDKINERDAASQLGSLATKAQECLACLGLSTPILDDLISEAVRLGSLGGKLSGAGGGGAFFLMFHDETGLRNGIDGLHHFCSKKKLRSTILGGFVCKGDQLEEIITL